MKRRSLGWLLKVGAVFITLVGCDDSLGPEKMLPLDSDVVFQIYEGYGAAGDQSPMFNAVTNPRVALEMRTAREYECSNYKIVYGKSVSGNRVEIRFLGRTIGPICETAIGPATARLFLDLATGVYELKFKYGTAAATFHVSLTDSALTITSGEEAFVSSGYAVYWRHPPKSFAYFCGTTTDSRWMCDEFAERLAAAVQVVEFSFPPQGQAPWARQWDGHYYNAPTRFFRYTREADFQEAGMVLEAFTREVIGTQQGINISLWNWRNDRHQSWLYRNP